MSKFLSLSKIAINTSNITHVEKTIVGYEIHLLFRGLRGDRGLEGLQNPVTIYKKDTFFHNGNMDDVRAIEKWLDSFK